MRRRGPCSTLPPARLQLQLVCSAWCQILQKLQHPITPTPTHPDPPRLGVSIRAMQDALTGLKRGRVPGPREMGTFVDIQMAVGFPVGGGWIGVRDWSRMEAAHQYQNHPWHTHY